MKRLLLAASLMVAFALPALANPELGCTSTEVASGTADAAAVAAGQSVRLMGFSCRENAGSTAEFIIRNGTSASDPAVAFVKLVSGESVREYFGDQGIQCKAGIYIDRVSGTTHISVFSRN